MKKSLILSAALLAAFGMKAEVINYDFNTNPVFCSVLYAPEEEDGWAWSGEYDFIDKTGMAVNTDGSMFNAKNADGVWEATKNRAISLADGLTYTLEGEEGDFTPIDMSQPFICWKQDGVGPARTHLFNSWNSTESYEDKDYGAASEDDFIASKGAIAFLRNGNTGSRTGTYVQFPAVKNPTKVTIWIGNQGGSYHEMGLYAEVTPVVNGVEGEMIPVQGPEDYKAKRYYKLEAALPADLAGDVAFRVGCGGSQLQIYHVAIETAEGTTAIEDIIANDNNENAPVYNVMGIEVDENYKGVVIKNGKKYIQR